MPSPIKPSFPGSSRQAGFRSWRFSDLSFRGSRIQVKRDLISTLKSFAEGDAIPVLKIALTEIEGILGDAYHKVHGEGAKIKKLLEFAVASAEAKAGQPDTLLFPAAFAHYLRSHTFAKFDP